MEPLQQLKFATPVPTLAFFSGLLAIYCLHRYVLSSVWGKSKRLPLPPAPASSWPLHKTADMLDGSVKPWRRFRQYSQEVGAKDLLMIPTLNRTNIIVNTAEAATELFEKRGANFGSRPNQIFENELQNKQMILVVCQDKDRVKRLRKLLFEQFSQTASIAAQDCQMEEAANLIGALLKNPTEFDVCYQRAMRSLVLRTTYGKAASMSEEELWEHVGKSDGRILPPIAPIIDLYPLLKYWPRWLPGGSFHKLAEERFLEDKAFWERVRDDVKSGTENGTIPSCFLSRMYETDAPKRHGFSDLDMAFTAANLFTAGGELPMITFRIFTLAMLHFPDAMAKAQAELDEVVGKDRFPCFEDKNRLPYTRAMIMEVQRWRSFSPIGVGHSNYEDEVYNGMRIPKGSTVVPNLWEMSRNPDVYPNPAVFDPYRFLSPDGKSVTRKNELMSFGYGSRICPAMYLADATVFINVANLLWAFDIVAPVDEEGNRVLPDDDIDNWDGVLPCQPKTFEATFVPRGDHVEGLVEAMSFGSFK